MNFQFSGMIYNTESRYLQAIAQSWLTGDGLNDNTTISIWLDTVPPATFAQECLDGWFSRDDDDTDRPDPEELTAAFAELANDREWMED